MGGSCGKKTQALEGDLARIRESRRRISREVREQRRAAYREQHKERQAAASADVNQLARVGDQAGLEAVAEFASRRLTELGDDGLAPLGRAAEAGDQEAVRALLAVKTDPNKGGHAYDSTPLHKAASAGQEEIVEALVGAKAEVNAQDAFGRTALFWAAGDGHENACRALMRGRADVSIADQAGVRPLEVASARGHRGVTELLSIAEEFTCSQSVFTY